IPGFGNLIIGSNGIETRTTQVLVSAEKPFSEESHWGATFAYTYSMAKQNHNVEEPYAFDGPTLGGLPFILSDTVPRHRFGATGTYRAGWGLRFGGKFTLATPTPKDDVACFLPPGQFFPTGSSCTPAAGTPQTTFGYRSVDVQVSKAFEFGGQT